MKPFLYKPNRPWKDIELWKDVTEEQWNDWIWQLTNTIRTLEDLKKVIHLTPDEEEGVRISTKTIPLNITPYYASLMNPDDARCPIRMQSVPISKEIYKTKYDLEDPLYEDEDSPVPGLTHRYPDRVLFLVTNQCSMYCRYCTRRRFSGQIGMGVPKKQLDAAIEYIRQTPVVRDVLISGGDGLLINDQILEYILKNLRGIDHVEIIRIGTRAPVVFPQRITDNLCTILKKYHPVWLNTHFNTSIEITEESKKACEMLANAGVPVGNQSVILAGINDSVPIMKRLMHDLVKIRVRPYYIYQCDLSEGISHFRAPVSKGLEIIEGLRGHTSGYAYLLLFDSLGWWKNAYQISSSMLLVVAEKLPYSQTIFSLNLLQKRCYATLKVLLRRIQSQRTIHQVLRMIILRRFIQMRRRNIQILEFLDY